MSRLLLGEFIYVAEQFLALEEKRLKNLYQEIGANKKEVANMLRRLDELELWFEKKRIAYLAVATVMAAEHEVALQHSLEESADAALTADQIFAQKIKRHLHVQKWLVENKKIIEGKFDRLIKLTLEIKTSAMAKFN